MRTCIYCGIDKNDDEFSDEHIWPDALGGDFLPSLWRSNDVCSRCNSISGVFVDGAFIKSWMGTAERSTGAREYLSPTRPGAGVLPLNYIGQLTDVEPSSGEVAELWVGPCGANIIHVRPANEDFGTYAGGDPRLKKKNAGRAYMALTSQELFWVLTSLASFKKHFSKAERFVTNMEIPPQWLKSFRPPDVNDPVQASDMIIVNSVVRTTARTDMVKVRARIDPTAGDRFLAKVALGFGYSLLGAKFLSTQYAKDLRAGFREADPTKRKMIPIRGTGYLDGSDLAGAASVLAWTGAWVLIAKKTVKGLSITVVSPSAKVMSILVTDDPSLLTSIDAVYDDGVVWVTVPALGEAVGPIDLPSYCAHQLKAASRPELAALASKRLDPSSLPVC